jgi:ABC-2 type transport system ATP-binding protein
MTHSEEHAIEVGSLTKRYGDLLAVNDVSFTVRKGELFAFLGPNGAGKTTTVEIIETIRTPSAGKVSIFGKDVTRHKRDIIPRIGVLPQGFASFDRLTVAESIRYYSKLFDCKATDIDGLLRITNLEDKRDVQFKALSGGLKQRLGIAVALVNDPEVVFFDEPTTGLDPHARRAVWDVLSGLKMKGKTVFLTTHYMEEAELLADTVAIIDQGQLTAIGSPDDLIERNANYLCLTLKTTDAAVMGTISQMGFEPFRDDRDNVKVRVKGADDVGQILDAIRNAGMQLSGLDVRKPNLEEVFLTITNKGLREHARAAGGDQ